MENKKYPTFINEISNYLKGTRVLKLEYLRVFFDYMFRIKHTIFKEPFKEIKR